MELEGWLAAVFVIVAVMTFMPWGRHRHLIVMPRRCAARGGGASRRDGARCTAVGIASSTALTSLTTPLLASALARPRGPE